MPPFFSQLIQFGSFAYDFFGTEQVRMQLIMRIIAGLAIALAHNPRCFGPRIPEVRSYTQVCNTQDSSERLISASDLDNIKAVKNFVRDTLSITSIHKHSPFEHPQ